MRITILQKGLLIIAVPLLCQLAFTLAYDGRLNAAFNSMKREKEWQEVCFLAQNMDSSVQNAVTYSLLAGLSDSDELRAKQKEKMREVIENHRALKTKLASIPQARFARREMSKQDLSRMLKMLLMFSRLPMDQSMTIAAALESVQVDPSMLLSSMQEREQSGLRPIDLVARASQALRKEENEFDGSSRSMESFVNMMALANAIVSLLLAAFFYFDISKRISAVRRKIELISMNQSPAALAGGNDEIADLDRTVHECANEIVQLQEFKNQMLGIVSHELKEPLSYAHSTMSWLAEQKPPELNEKGQQHCRRAERNLDRLMRLVSDLLALQQMEGSEFKLSPSKTSLANIVNESIASVENLAQARQLSFDLKIDDCILTADRERLLQVLINLLSNAIKYAEPGSVITLSSKLDSHEVKLTVCNYGREIPEEQKSRIFSRFYQVEAQDGSKRGGSGLGLNIAQSIIEQHNGKIGFESQNNETSFWFTLPRDFEEKKTTELAEIQKAPKRSLKFRFWHKGLILVGLPLLLNLFFLFAVKSMWTAIESSLARTRDYSAASTQLFISTSAVVNTFWINALAGAGQANYADSLKRISKRTSVEIQKLQKLAEELPETGLARTVELHKRMQSDFKHFESAKTGLLIKEIQDSGFFARCQELLKTSAEAARLQQSGIRKEEAFQNELIKKTRFALIAIPAASALLSIMLAFYFARSVSGRLLNVTLNTSLLAKRQKLLQPLKGSDEIAELDQYFHDVASKIVRLDEFKQQMISVVSHELRSPLTGMMLSFQMLEEGAFGTLAAEARAKLAKSELESGRLIRLINNLLDFEKLQVAKIEMKTEELNAKELLSKVLEAVAPEANEANVRLEYSGEDFIASWDGDRLQQALINMLVIAVHQSKEGTKIELELAKQENTARIQIRSDSAVLSTALSKTLQAHANDSASANRSSDYELGASGLALAICNSLIEMHGGKTEIESNENKSRISILLPLQANFDEQNK